MFSLFSGFTTLAGSIIEVWVVLEKRKQGELDREHQRQLQKAQHQHELFLRRRSTAHVEDNSQILNVNSPFLERLRVEAVFLSAIGLEVVYEPLHDGYGLALPVSENLILAFWVPAISDYRDRGRPIWYIYAREYACHMASVRPGAERQTRINEL